MSTPHLTLMIGSRNYSSWSLRPWLALRLSGLPFDTRLFDLKGPGRAHIATASPSGLVPCLIVKPQSAPEYFVWDSLAVCETLNELSPDAQLWPSDPRTRAWARSVASEMHSGFADLRRTCPMDILNRYPGHAITAETQQNIDRITKIWTECRQAHRDKGDFLFGPFTIADCFYAPVVTRFQSYDVKLSGLAAEYSEAVRSWAALREWTDEAAREEGARAA